MRNIFRNSVGPCVAVLDAEAPPGLAFTRSLGRGGVGVRVYSPRRYPVARMSRYCSDFGHSPNPENAEAFLPWLRQEVDTGKISLVAPTSDLIAFYMAEFPEVFPEQQAQATPSRESVLNMLFKDRFDATCKRHGMGAPWAAFPRSRAEALDLAKTLPYPIILKPKSHVGVGWARGQVVHDATELAQRFQPYPVDAQRAVIMRRFPDLAWPMLQEYVPEALQHLYSVGGLLSNTGDVVAFAGSRKTLQWPPTLGVGVLFEAWNDTKALAMGLAFARAVIERGIFELEVILDPRTGRYVAIDLNPRAHGHITFDIARGNDLPLWWYRQATGEPVSVQPAAKSNIRWLHSIPYHVGQIIGLAKGPQRFSKLTEYAGNLRGPTVDIINDAADPLPSLAHAAYMFRHPGGLIKPFLHEP